MKWYRKAAKQGHCGAQFNLGLRFFKGEGVNEDKEKAVEWYREAADQGHSRAQIKVCLCYFTDEGVEKDLEVAVEWLAVSIGVFKVQRVEPWCQHIRGCG